jgi:hypothetical protein
MADDDNGTMHCFQIAETYCLDAIECTDVLGDNNARLVTGDLSSKCWLSSTSNVAA